ncbi:F-box domain-containing protein [Mycena sanguinolenta]|uniref:F-box domain-containing protein n=1 Tax=Mycena sanguinolenta TaxID=230812 RepID=A0A8H6XJB3_9AGAR|nr:F-box domain-containing protein [Mycena sanguinolenta]
MYGLEPSWAFIIMEHYLTVSSQMPSVCSACGAPVISTGDDVELNSRLVPAAQTLARLSELSATNEPPHDAELSSIQFIVDKTSTRLAGVDAEISRLKDRLRQLEKERTVLSKYYAQNTRILSPLRIENCPWVLTHVCGGWRGVALSRPSLWSLIVINFLARQEYPLEMVRTQIERAKLLKIRFFGYEDLDSRIQISMFELLAHDGRSSIFS